LGTVDPGLAVAACGIVAIAVSVLQFFNRKVTMIEEDQPAPVTGEIAG
jgi:hypothetical protein